MQIQHVLNADVVMQFDECTPYEIDGQPVTREQAGQSMRLSLRWAKRSLDEFQREENTNALFAIVQGGMFEELRDESLAALEQMNFHGVAIGGLSVGEPKADMQRILRHTGPKLPAHKPHYLMGVGTPEDLVEGVANGIDMFDCVMPTRAGRHGLAYTRFGPMNLKNARYAEDSTPLDPASDCPAARDYSRAYLHHLVKAGEILGMMLLTQANVAYYQFLMAGLRAAIRSGTLNAFIEETSAGWAAGPAS